MSDNGVFTHLNLYKYFMDAGEHRFTTLLYFSEGFKEYRVYFKNGRVSFVQSSDKDERFGEFLIFTNRITVEQYRVTSEKIMVEGKKFGYTLIEEGFMTVDELYHALNEYMIFMLEKVFSLKEGVYANLEFEKHADIPMDLTIDYRKAIYHGIKANNFFSLIEHHIKDLSLAPDFIVSVEEIFKVLPLTVEEQGVLEWIDGQNSISAICNYSDLTQFETLKLLLILKLCGFVSIVEPADSGVMEVDIEMEVEELLKKYNSKFEVVYSLLNAFDPLLFEKMNREVFENLKERYDELIREIDLSAYGYIDFEVFYRNLYIYPPNERVDRAKSFLESVLQEVIFFIEENCSREMSDSIKKAVYERKD